jgi:hypothetical protein
MEGPASSRGIKKRHYAYTSQLMMIMMMIMIIMIVTFMMMMIFMMMTMMKLRVIATEIYVAILQSTAAIFQLICKLLTTFSHKMPEYRQNSRY